MASYNDNQKNWLNLENLFYGLKRTWEKEQRDLILERKSQKEEREYFDLIKFFFSPPDVA